MRGRRRTAGPKTIDIYARISQDYDGTTRSVDSQVEDCLDEIAEHDDWTGGKTFTDHALSGWNPRVVRPNWNLLMARLESGESNGVIVYDLSRFTRKPAGGERLIELADRGIIVASLTTEYDLMSADGRKHFRDAMVGAAFESDKNSERSQRGKQKKARRGLSNAATRGFGLPGRATARPKDWQPGDPEPPMVPDEQVAGERDVIRELARRLLAGETLEALTREINTRGVRTVTGRQWTTTALRETLQRPSLAGLVGHHGEVVAEVRDGAEPVLDRETWEAVAAIFAARRRGRPADAMTYLLSGLMRCGRCGTPLTGRTRSTWKPYADGGVARQYWCPLHAGKGGCGRVAIDQRFADAIVEEAAKQRLGDPAHADRLARQVEHARAEREAIRGDIRRAEEVRHQLAERLGRGEVSLDQFDTANDALRARLDRLHEQLAEVDAPEVSAARAARDIDHEWEHGSVQDRRALIRRAFPKLTILPASGRGAAGMTSERFAWDGVDAGADREDA